MTHLLALVGVAIISFSAIFVRLAAVAPPTAAFFRAAYAVPVLFVLSRLAGDARPVRARLTAGLAGFFLGVDLGFWHQAIDDIGAGLATILGNTQVVIVAFLAWWVHGERPRRETLLAIPLVFAGVVLISGIGSAAAYGAHPQRGVLFGALTAVAYSGYLLVYRHAGRGGGPTVGPLLDVSLGAAAGGALYGLFDGRLDLVPHWPAHGWLLAMAMASQVVGWQLIGFALPRLAALETSVMLLLQPVMTMTWAWMLFDERLSPLQGGGVVLVLGGVSWISIRGAVTRVTPSLPPKGTAPEDPFANTRDAQ